MLYEAIDHVVFPVESLDAAAPFERLGLRLTPAGRMAAIDANLRALATGDESNLFLVNLVQSDTPAAFLQPRGGLVSIVLRVADLDAALQELADRGVSVEERQQHPGPDGSVYASSARLAVADQAVVQVGLVQRGNTAAARAADLNGLGMMNHELPLKRLDHLAAVAPDLEKTTSYWTDLLGVPLFGEVRSPTTIIRQFKIGDAILELLGPATPDSAIATRPPGLVSMCAYEVADLAAAVAHARAAGFNPPDPATGVLPGTRTATIPAAELSGMSLQLLQYV